MGDVPPGLITHPDRLRWNAKYARRTPRFVAHPLLIRALSLRPPAGPVLDLSCGPSGSALHAAARGRPVTAVDISEVALGALAAEARRRGLAEMITVVQADLGEWTPAGCGHAIVLCTGYWDRAVFDRAWRAVRPGGVLAWEAFGARARRRRPDLPPQWCLDPGEPASLLPADFTVVEQADVDIKTRLLARRDTPPSRDAGACPGRTTPDG